MLVLENGLGNVGTGKTASTEKCRKLEKRWYGNWTVLKNASTG